MWRNSVWLAASLAALVAGCAVPIRPNVMVLPARGKTIEQFQTEDVACQQYAASAIGADRTYTYYPQLQLRYDTAYQQCMYAKGNQIPGAVQRVQPYGAAPGYPPPPSGAPPSPQPPAPPSSPPAGGPAPAPPTAPAP